ncbi:hypothetical protein BJX99DRAFT_51978 [Aspergillus californicus]
MISDIGRRSSDFLFGSSDNPMEYVRLHPDLQCIRMTMYYAPLAAHIYITSTIYIPINLCYPILPTLSCQPASRPSLCMQDTVSR